MSQLNPEHYTVAWIAPLQIEAQAALLMLDERHRGRFPVSRGDDYIYHAGEIAGHKIIVATLPAGQDYGSGSAAALASHVRRFFPNLWFGLLVGVAAGLPDLARAPPRDIRLGDVLVGLPDSDSAGLIAYDLGKETEEGYKPLHFGQVLANTAPIIRSAIGAIRLNAPNEAQIIRPYYEAIRDKEHETGTFADPGQDADKLHENTHDQVDVIVSRQLRPDSRRTRVWYGPIGSGETLFKNARKRNELRDRFGVIGLEMEAAGTMGQIPVGVIRGVCDYGDRHKNDVWQPYAAAMAAAYAKAILHEIFPTQTLYFSAPIQSAAIRQAGDQRKYPGIHSPISGYYEEGNNKHAKPIQSQTFSTQTPLPLSKTPIPYSGILEVEERRRYSGIPSPNSGYDENGEDNTRNETSQETLPTQTLRFGTALQRSNNQELDGQRPYSKLPSWNSAYYEEDDDESAHPIPPRIFPNQSLHFRAPSQASTNRETKQQRPYSGIPSRNPVYREKSDDEPTELPGSTSLVSDLRIGASSSSTEFAQRAPTPVEQSARITNSIPAPYPLVSLLATAAFRYVQIFEKYHKNYQISGPRAIEIFGFANLDNRTLEKICKLVDEKRRGYLDLDGFIIAMHLIELLESHTLQSLPNKLQLKLPELFVQYLPEMLGEGYNPDLIPPLHIRNAFKYVRHFERAQEGGHLSGAKAEQMFIRSGLTMEKLERIWDLADVDCSGQLSLDEFIVAMHLTALMRSGELKALPDSRHCQHIPLAALTYRFRDD